MMVLQFVLIIYTFSFQVNASNKVESRDSSDYDKVVGSCNIQLTRLFLFCDRGLFYLFILTNFIKASNHYLYAIAGPYNYWNDPEKLL